MTQLIASIVTVGDELLVGQVVDTNASYLAAELTRLGISVSYSLTVADDQEAIKAAIEDGVRRCDLTLVTGGLGPTPDDLTREAAAAFTGSPLTVDPTILAAIERHFASLGRSVPSGSERVASVPGGFEILPNSKGTAPGLWHRGANGSVVVLLPGVPHEMKAIFSDHVIPRIMQMDGRAEIAQRTIKTAGVGETLLQSKIESISHLLEPDLQIAYLPGAYSVRVRLTIRGNDAGERLDAAEKFIRAKLGSVIFGQDDDTLESILGSLLRNKGMTIAVAESCTGGSVLDRLTDVPGSSDYVMGGVIAYSNLVKQHHLDVDVDILDQFGAVSEPVAVQMAEGVRTCFGSDIGLSVTGIAGPSGGTAGKPVGLVWIGYADAHEAWAVKHQFGQDRDRNKQKSVVAALNIVLQSLRKRSNRSSNIDFPSNQPEKIG
ncbi:MAG: competence/damage-inducible protein A [Rhodothermaceae bacterium]|nr:competence/damage-inducible protein A [Rhodothermaceae bacterium]MXZ56987.1 competence/damage-inducible protein A [Rhodothermaceae bacterium]MYB90722.1 competence/damage-inducible protein A [Rhodothermaceae bacterium]MYD68721.1 competence/damage-inducible protein A [Rhodothermaceae bacterium]MYG45310.1 competence/damage-inducible protein A [Rhodothermaceae bacterium]